MNCRPHPYQGCALPTELYQHTILERAAGIEPAASAWKAEVLPLYDARFARDKKVVEGEGFEPSKAEPSDLQSDPFDHSGTPPDFVLMVPAAGVELATY